MSSAFEVGFEIISSCPNLTFADIHKLQRFVTSKTRKIHEKQLATQHASLIAQSTGKKGKKTDKKSKHGKKGKKDKDSDESDKPRGHKSKHKARRPDDGRMGTSNARPNEGGMGSIPDDTPLLSLASPATPGFARLRNAFLAGNLSPMPDAPLGQAPLPGPGSSGVTSLEQP